MTKLEQLTRSAEKIAMLTCYDATFAKLSAAAGVDILLVGDSLGMVIQGAADTLSVTMHDMIYHTQCVAKGAADTYIIADMPVASYEQDENLAYANAQLLLDAGAHMVKLEGGGAMVKTARYLVDHGVAVCAHLGFTPQSVQQLGGYKIQGKTEDGAKQIMQDAIAMSAAGIGLLVLEMVPASLAKRITANITTPTIGIGAGPDCRGQVLVLQDLLGIYSGPATKKPHEFKSPRFVRNFLQESNNIQAAVAAYVIAVKNQSFPTAEHSF